MAKKLDLKDRRILYELDKNARISNAQIAKRVGVSPEVVHYRINKLEGDIVTKYHTLVNYDKMGLIHFKICIQFNGLPLKEEEEIYSNLKKINQVIWIAKCSGDWDCMVSCTVKNLKEFAEIKDRVVSLCYPYVNHKEVSIISNMWAFPRRFLLGKQEEGFKMKGEALKLDKIDLSLLRLLAENARKPIIDIARELDITVKVASYRIKKLIRNGAIDHFRIVIDYDTLGLHFYKVFFYLKNPEEKRLRQLIEKMNNNLNLVYNIKVIGKWDLEPEFEFFDKKDFDKLMQELMDEFSDIIQRISRVNILKEYKYTLFYK